MKTKVAFLAVGLALLASGRFAPAQYDAYPPYGYGWGGGGYHHASTVEEGFQRGAADVIRSKGLANLLNAEAAIKGEEARSAYIDNRAKWTQTYFEMRQMNRQYRQAERGPRPTSEDIYRYAKERLPDRLSPTELNPVSGAIDWPVVLMGDEFAEDRKAMEELFAARLTHAGAADPSLYIKINQTGRHMQQQLKARISDYPTTVYLASKKFLDGLMFESVAPAG